MSYPQPTDSKKDEFRKYLERSGVIDAVTKVFVALYEEPEKPANALDFIKTYLGAPTTAEYEGLKSDNDRMKKELDDAMARIRELEAKVGEAPAQ
eukprot:tig00001600_g9399.t1